MKPRVYPPTEAEMALDGTYEVKLQTGRPVYFGRGGTSIGDEFRQAELRFVPAGGGDPRYVGQMPRRYWSSEPDAEAWAREEAEAVLAVLRERLAASGLRYEVEFERSEQAAGRKRDIRSRLVAGLLQAAGRA